MQFTEFSQADLNLEINNNFTAALRYNFVALPNEFMQNIGILLPRSTYYETISFDLYEGLRSGLKHLGLDEVKIITENIGFGAERQSLYRSAERLLMEENVSVVFAYIAPRSAQLLRPLFMAANKLLIVLDSGAGLPQEWPVSPNILSHSLHNALGAWLSGQRAASGFTQGGMVTGYYDGGYLHTMAITEGFTQHGGEIKFNHATGYRLEDFSVKPLKEFLDQYPNSCILSLFSGDFNQWFLRDLTQLFGDNIPAVYGAPFGLEETMLARSPYVGTVSGTVSWSHSLQNPSNKVFKKTVSEQGRKPNLFSLLGWEAAFLTKLYAELSEEHKFDLPAIVAKLKTSAFESPRGTIRFHDQTNTTLSPMYEANVIADANGNCGLDILGQIQGLETSYNTMIGLELNNAISGWYNSYTCN